MRLRILLGAAAAGLLVAGGWLLLHGLTAGEPYSRLSVWADDAGRLHLDYRACGDELVTDVVLFDGDPTAGHAAALWRITFPGIARTTFTIGRDLRRPFQQVPRLLAPHEPKGPNYPLSLKADEFPLRSLQFA